MSLSEQYLEYAKINEHKFIQKIIGGKEPQSKKEAVFMAGSPGAGKTEFVSILSSNYEQYVIIDADRFRLLFPDYNGENSILFQQACGWLVQQTLSYCLENGYAFILDGTFAVRSISKVIKRVLKKDFIISVFYVYQEPRIAWKFTQKREQVEGRHVPKATFIEAFIHSRENIIKVKRNNPQVLVNLIIKNYENDISEVHFDAENMELLLPLNYTVEELEEILYE